MKLNPDCIRDVLLYLEKNLVFGGRIGSPQIVSDLSDKYSSDDVSYSIYQIAEIGYLDYEDINGGYIIRNIKPSGHEFLENIRDKGNWEKTKNKAQQVGAYGLNVIRDIAVLVVSESISRAFR